MSALSGKPFKLLNIEDHFMCFINFGPGIYSLGYDKELSNDVLRNGTLY